MSRETKPLITILASAGRSREGSCRPRTGWYIPNESPTSPGVDMLDAFIIERIRREQESRRPARQPMRIEIPREPPPGYRGQPDPRGEDTEDPPTDRGVAIIDFTI